MEKVLEKNETKNKVINVEEEKKHIKILGITSWRLFAYFIIYSIIGFIVETLFGMAKYGTLESRQSFLYGPFCAIYGVGAIIMILSLQYFKKNYTTLFVGGCIVGSITEYLVSWIGEMLLHLKWWDYSKMPFNINGRICLLYSIFWGFLGLYLMISANPRVDKLINFIKGKISTNFLQALVVLCTVFMFVDCVSTAFALAFFNVRTIKEKGIEVKNQDYINSAYEKIYGNELLDRIINKFFSDEKMLMTFPRLTIESSNGNIVRVSELYPALRTYYCKFGDDD